MKFRCFLEVEIESTNFSGESFPIDTPRDLMHAFVKHKRHELIGKKELVEYGYIMPNGKRMRNTLSVRILRSALAKPNQ